MFRHLNDAVLRRYVDEPEALLSYEKEHLVQCMRCRYALETMRANAQSARRALDDAEEAPDLSASRAAVLQRAQGMGNDTPVVLQPVRRSARDWRWLSAIAAAAVFVALLFAYAPFRVYAQNFLTIFEPHQVAPITVTRADIRQLDGVLELKELGTVQESGSRAMQRFTSLAAASRYANEPVLRPSYLPASIPHSNEYQVDSRRTVRFTFDERKAKASAARKHVTLPPPPAGLDGATLTAEVGPIVVQSYGTQLSKHHVHVSQLPRDTVFVVQGPAPSVRSTSVSADTIESYLLSLPNVPEDVKAQIRAIKDPASTLPIPIEADKSTAQPVTIQGSRGLLIGDNTGIGSAITWVSSGRIYWVAGGFSADEMTKVANSMTRE